MIGFGQNWRYSSGGNDFDGKYRTSSIVGTGDDYPYNSPRLVINYFEVSNKINFYIDDAGYFPSSSNTIVKLSFSNEKGTIYQSESVKYSSDRKTIFLGEWFSPNSTKKFVIFQKLMEASYVNIRIYNKYGQNDMRFSLKGSTKAIKYVIPYEELLLANLEIENNRLNALKVEDAILYQRDSILRIYLKNYSLSKEMRSSIIEEINNQIKLKGYVINNIDSLSVWKVYDVTTNQANKYYLNAKVFYKSFYAQKFFKLINVEENYIDSIPFAVGLIEADEIKEIVKEGLNEKPKRKDYKSSSDYMKALRKYHKSNKDNK